MDDADCRSGLPAAIRAAAERCVEYLKTRYNPTRVLVCGSAAHNSPSHKGFNLGIAVEGLPPDRFFGVWSDFGPPWETSGTGSPGDGSCPPSR